MSNEIWRKNFKEWLDNVEKGKNISLDFPINSSTDIVELHNFFLVCQKCAQQNLKEQQMKLNIKCAPEDEFRIIHYLYMARYYRNIKEIKINRKKLGKLKEDPNFYRRFPLILIDIDMYQCLSKKVSTIEADLKCDNLITMQQFDGKLKSGNKKLDLILKICIHNLICKMDNEGKNELYSKRRNKYFQSEKFHRMIHDLPILALFIFSIYDRAKGNDAINDWKQEQRLTTNKKNIQLSDKGVEEIYPTEDKIVADVFNAWDISDGLLQLIENIVQHAGKDKDSEEDKEAGEGTMILRIHRNEEASDKISNKNPELYGRYPQYFGGYRNEYVIDEETGQEVVEMELLNKYREDLKNSISTGQYVDGDIVQRYEQIRKVIEQRRFWRRKIEYFLEIRLTDYSGKNMMDVFLKNLDNRKDPNHDNLKDFHINSFFNPNRDERKAFAEYYKGDNIIRHYGLQIFASVISNNEGAFELKSRGNCGKFESYSNTNPKVQDNLVLSGTQYDILLPLTTQERNDNVNTLVNADINYKFRELTHLEETNDNKNIIEEYYRLLHQEGKKESHIARLSECLEEISDNNRILVFDCDQINNSEEFEMFCKSILLTIVQEDNKGKFLNIAVKNCEEYHFVNMIRFFIIYYDKTGKNNWLENQIYLCGKDSMEEFLISGNDIQMMIARMEKLTFSRRMSPRCMRILTKMLERRSAQDESNLSQGNEFSFTPFDLLIQNENGQTIFEQNVLKVLSRNIQEIESGCKIHPTHMRIGSKIHIDTFYEAELLFYNDYYVNRFAYMVLEQLVKENIDFEKPICLIGYEIYSEMLICRVKHYIFERFGVECSYAIFETEMDSFDNNCLKIIEKHNTQTVLIVPVNSTLTTFNKLEAQIKRALKKKFESPKQFNIRAYIGIIQILDSSKNGEQEKEYWDNHNLVDKVIYSKKLLAGNEHKASYIISTYSIWENPIKCSCCYPTDCLFEMPLIETDKTSVVPTQLIGLKEKIDNEIREGNVEVSGIGKIGSLDGHFYYDHVRRGMNHYQVYIKTANYFAKYEFQIKEWLQEKVAPDIKNKKAGILSFDILVHALHFSNAAFVEAVNEKVFNGASYTIRIEAGKEFKENVETKFSDLKALYANLKRTKRRAELNFHFVDDNINLGNTIYRMRHLISSMFPQASLSGEETVKVNIFSSVIVILNRLSKASICDYVKNEKDYYYYINLKISSMRTHEDACYLCKEEKNAQILYESSATNALGDFWIDKKERVKLKSLAEAKEYKEKLKRNGSKKYERYYKRIYCAHTLNKSLTELGVDKNEPIKVLDKFVNLVNGERKEPWIEYFMSYLNVFAEPFISYRKSNREGVFVLLILFMEMLIMENTVEDLEIRVQKESEDGTKEKIDFTEMALNSCKELLKRFSEDRTAGKISDNQCYDLFKLLLKLLTDLKSNYILREDRIVPILAFNRKYQKNKESNFILYYLSLVKRVISLHKDESKSTRFEIVLHQSKGSVFKEAKQYQCQYQYEDFIKEVEYIWNSLYLENTLGVYSAVKDLINIENITDESLGEYYFDNYRKIMNMNLGNQNLVEVSQKLSKFYQDVRKVYSSDNTSKNKRSIAFYEELSSELINLLEAQRLQFVVKYPTKQLVINELNQVVYEQFDDYRVFAEAEQGKTRIRYNIFDNDEIANGNNELLLDTLYVKDRRAIIKYASKNSKGFNVPVFVLIEFKTDDYEEILKYARLLLMFRNDIMQCLAADFDNNIIQEWLEKNNTMLQLAKARAGFHTVENDSFREGNLWNLAEGFFYGKKTTVQGHWEQNEDKLAGCVLGLMNNIRIGRTNVMLLSGGTFQDEYFKKYNKFDIFQDDFAALNRLYFKNGIRICDKTGKEIVNRIPNEGKDRVIVFPEEIFNRSLVENKNGTYCKVRNYLLYFIFELIHSAATYGKKTDGKVNVRIYDEKEYLYFENLIEDGFNEANVISSLRREGNGISLATICEFFIENYTNRYVSLEFGEYFKIGLPIFTN